MEKIICFIDLPHIFEGKFRNNTGTVLSAEGEAVKFQMSQQGRYLDDWFIQEQTPTGCTGLMVWEGDCDNLSSMTHGGEWEPILHGKWRVPTDDELRALVGKPQVLTVEAAAIRGDDGKVWSLPKPNRHNNVISYMRTSGYTGSVGGASQGFLLSDGRFCNRDYARKVASRAKQIIPGRTKASILTTEDLW